MDHKAELKDLIETVERENASDLHIAEGRQPVVRIAGSLIPLVKKPATTRESIEGFLEEILGKGGKDKFMEEKEVDFSYSHDDNTRFRGNGYFRQGKMSIALRYVPQEIKTLEQLGLPSFLANFTEKTQGFFLVVGPVGQGKSTTLASMIEMINTSRAEHIITIEDPIEYVFTPKKSIIDQREVKIDTKDFHTALVNVFREDVDVVMIGEMRDPQTISTAVTAAETGHLVFSTLHTNDAAQTIERIIDSFPAGQQDQIRIQLAGSLAGIFSQRLIPRISGGLIPAYELLLNNNAVANLIRERRTYEINTVLETGSEEGMITLDRSLADLVRRGEITVESAYQHSINPASLEKLL